MTTATLHINQSFMLHWDTFPIKQTGRTASGTPGTARCFNVATGKQRGRKFAAYRRYEFLSSTSTIIQHNRRAAALSFHVSGQPDISLPDNNKSQWLFASFYQQWEKQTKWMSYCTVALCGQQDELVAVDIAPKSHIIDDIHKSTRPALCTWLPLIYQCSRQDLCIITLKPRPLCASESVI